MCGNRAYRDRLGKDRSPGESRHSIGSPKGFATHLRPCRAREPSLRFRPFPALIEHAEDRLAESAPKCGTGPT
jgi:hypothetical protein